jgi:hypothetical protein
LGAGTRQKANFKFEIGSEKTKSKHNPSVFSREGIHSEARTLTNQGCGTTAIFYEAEFLAIVNRERAGVASRWNLE